MPDALRTPYEEMSDLLWAPQPEPDMAQMSEPHDDGPGAARMLVWVGLGTAGFYAAVAIGLALLALKGAP